MEITPYQMTLIDPFLEETRTLLEESFPGKTKEEKLQYAALEAAELKRNPLFDQPGRLGNAVDFSREVFPYSPVFADLYSVGAQLAVKIARLQGRVKICRRVY